MIASDQFVIFFNKILALNYVCSYFTTVVVIGVFKMAKKENSLSAFEWQIMEILWNRERATVRDVFENLTGQVR